MNNDESAETQREIQTDREKNLRDMLSHRERVELTDIEGV